MTVNRLKSYLCVYQRPIEVALIIAGLLLVGGVTGYASGGREMVHTVNAIAVKHAQEIDRLQTTHRAGMKHMSDRLRDLVMQQSDMAQRLAQASREARSAAATASTAAKNAANANIKKREVHARQESPFPEDGP